MQGSEEGIPGQNIDYSGEVYNRPAHLDKIRASEGPQE